MSQFHSVAFSVSWLWSCFLELGEERSALNLWLLETGLACCVGDRNCALSWAGLWAFPGLGWSEEDGGFWISSSLTKIVVGCFWCADSLYAATISCWNTNLRSTLLELLSNRSHHLKTIKRKKLYKTFLGRIDFNIFLIFFIRGMSGWWTLLEKNCFCFILPMKFESCKSFQIQTTEINGLLLTVTLFQACCSRPRCDITTFQVIRSII